MSFDKLLSQAVKIEGKRSSVKIHDARELMAILKKFCMADKKHFLTIVKYLAGG